METRILATTLAVHRQAGGNVTHTLERLAEVMRQRLTARGRFRAAMAGGRFATFLIAAIGPLAFFYLVRWQPEYSHSFFDQPLGLALLATVVLLQVIGLTWIAGLLRTEH
jgi:tight adherence protein B